MTNNNDYGEELPFIKKVWEESLNNSWKSNPKKT